jgi:hypothetical protein
LELLPKVAKTRYASNFIMLHHFVEVKPALLSMMVGMTCIERRPTYSKRGSMVQRVLIDEDWWSKIDFLLKFTLLAFELLRDAETNKPLLGEINENLSVRNE